MSLLKITEENEKVIRFVPSMVPVVAMVCCLVIGAVFAAAAVMKGRDPLQLVVLLMAACAFLLTAILVRSQKRAYEVNMVDKAVYVMGRQQPDIYVIPFSEIAALRVVRRVRMVEVSMHDRKEELVHSSKRPGRPEFSLDILRRDSGYETMDKSMASQEIVQLVNLLADRTGLAVVDDAGLGVAREAVARYEAEPVDVPESPSPGSVIRLGQGRRVNSFVWTLSPGAIVLGLMGLVGIGMLGVGALGILEFLKEDGNHWVAVAATMVAGVLAYQISWRFLHGALCNGYVTLGNGEMQCGYYCMDNDNEAFSIPLQDIVTFRVVAPRYRRCVLEVLTRDGKSRIVARLNPGLFPLTVGDLHWLNARLSLALQKAGAA
ncbi:hypothetical protein N1030_07645 [Desulfovibrio mangrovi]|uniref:hypothetical protein n=1 Tax=Desulfovibrio mangrovi TaxID=2976983 RepID=UPI0022462556|nr:hypothetical protein [Desulfovibrio mangrovi]UZP68836.1 hypothetical protein N1030_07645 [Desulfovibrio mangrovi]